MHFGVQLGAEQWVGHFRAVLGLEQFPGPFRRRLRSDFGFGSGVGLGLLAQPALAQRVDQRVHLGGDFRAAFRLGSRDISRYRNRIGRRRLGFHAENLPEDGPLGRARGPPFREGFLFGDLASLDIPDRLADAAPAGRAAFLELCLAVARAGLDIGHHPRAPGLALDLG